MRWCTSTRRREESSDNVRKSRLTAPYLWCCLAVRSRPSDPQQRRTDGRTACDGDVEHRAGCFLPNVDAAYWRYRRLVCRDPPSMAEPCAADNGGQSRRVCSRLAAVYPTSAVRRAVTQTVRGRAFACCDDTSSGVQNSLELVSEWLGCTGENSTIC